MSRTNENVVGKKFSMLTVIKKSHQNNEKRWIWICLCDCGQYTKSCIRNLKCGNKKSCGCNKNQFFKHRMKGTKEYAAWSSAKNRALCPTSKDFARYGATGITFDPKWRNDFQAFYDHIGPCPGKSFSLDRIDNTKGYIQGNVRWATRNQQQRNKSTSYFIKIKGAAFDCLPDAAKHFHVAIQTIHKWLHGHFDSRRQVFIPPKPDCFKINKYGALR